MVNSLSSRSMQYSVRNATSVVFVRCCHLTHVISFAGNCWDISLWLLTRATLHSLLFETVHVNSIASRNIPGADGTSGTSVHVENVNILSNTVWVDLCVWLRVKVTSLSRLNPSPGAKFPQCLWVLSALPSPQRYTSLWVCVCVRVYVHRDASVFLSL